jgi:hypothetical protein
MTDAAQTVKPLARRVAAVVFAGILIAGCAWASFAVGEWLRDRLLAAAEPAQQQAVTLLTNVAKSITASLPFLTVAMILGVGRELLTIFPTILDLFHGGRWMQLWRPVVSLSSAFLMLGLAGVSEPRAPEPFRVTGRAIYLAAAAEEASPSVPSLPLFHFQNAQVREGRLTARGLELRPEDQASLKETLAALSQCADADRPVVVEVVGFASATPFYDNGRPHEDSAALNVDVANARARAVYETLIAAADSLANVTIQQHAAWQDFGEMEQDWRRRDLAPSGIEKGERAAFQRVVVLDVLQTGRCEQLIDGRIP